MSMSSKTERARLARLLVELAALDRDEYRKLRGEIWEAVSASHSSRPEDERVSWVASSS